MIDDKQKKLRQCDSFGFVRAYTADPAESLALISDFCDEVRRRKDDENEDIMLLVIHNADIIKRICTDKNDSKNLTLALKTAAEAGAFILISGVENQPVSFSASELLKALKEERKAVLFAPITENKVYELPGRPKPDSVFNNSMGYYIEGNAYSKIKIFNPEV